MTQLELEERIGFDLTDAEFEAANSQYMDCNLDKDAFAKVYRAYYYALNPERKKQHAEERRRAKLTAWQKACEDIRTLAAAEECNWVRQDVEADITRMRNLEDSDSIDIYVLIRKTGAEIYMSWDAAINGHRGINAWGSSRKALYRVQYGWGAKHEGIELMMNY